VRDPLRDPVVLTRSASRNLAMTMVQFPFAMGSRGVVWCEEISDRSGSMSSASSRLEQGDENEVNKHRVEAERALSRGILESLPEQVSLGLVLGVATGYSAKRIGKALLFVIGAELIVLQYLAVKGWLEINWTKISHDLTPTINRNMFAKFLDVVTYRLPFTSSFTAGIYTGLKYLS